SLQAGLTKTAVTTQDAQPDLFPRASVSPRMPITAHCVGLPLDHLMSVLLTMRLAVSDERTASSVLARFRWAFCHCLLCIRVWCV
ncbi:hypothetical protein, partial [Burkholderia ambifaria]|uniref:hypothetical protein n=1 Tax=Burkholderia ambifaria TaxID=152480 RepID=UPI001ABA9A9E